MARTHSVKLVQISTPMLPEVVSMQHSYEVSEATLAAEMQRASAPTGGSLRAQGKRVSPFIAPILEQMLTRDPRSTFDITQAPQVPEMRANLEICTRAHDEMYLTEAVPPQRSCSNGDACVSSLSVCFWLNFGLTRAGKYESGGLCPPRISSPLSTRSLDA